jgi:UDP-2-acetamido-2-deoxy-ribo-hexuluronate aminotransferase
MTVPFIDLRTQFKVLEPTIRARIDAVLEHGQYIMGPEVDELETRLADFTGSKHCITVASGTEALVISLMALGVGSGDEVITTPFTFAATAEAIVLVGATPVFADVRVETANIDPREIEKKITPRTKAIIPVSLYGQPADMDEINRIAAEHGGIPVIEDAAQSFGAMYRGRKSCNLSLIGCTSFFPSKPLGCYGDGGAIFTSSDSLAKSAREIRVHGQSRRYHHVRIGVGGRMDTIQCAIVLAKLDRFSWEVSRRAHIGAVYNEIFDSFGINRIYQDSDLSSVFAQYTIVIPERERVQTGLAARGVPTAVHYPDTLGNQPAYRVYCCPSCTPNSEFLSQRVMSLPMSADLTESDQIRVAETVAACLALRD